VYGRWLKPIDIYYQKAEQPVSMLEGMPNGGGERDINHNEGKTQEEKG